MPALSGLSSLIRMLLWEIPPLVPLRCAQEDRWSHHASTLAKIIAAAECLESSQKTKQTTQATTRYVIVTHIQPMGYSRYPAIVAFSGGWWLAPPHAWGFQKVFPPRGRPALPQTRGSTTHHVSNIIPGGDGARPHVEEAVRSRHGSWNLMEVRRQMVVMSPVYACVAERTLR
jgi:hypothetical protein